MSLEYFSDRCSSLDLEIHNADLCGYLTKIGAVSPNFKTAHFCGLVVLDSGSSCFFLPRKMLAKAGGGAGEAKLLAIMTMKALVRFGRENARSGLGIKQGEEGNIAPVLDELARDFRDYGIYSERFRNFSKNRGKTDWRRTVAMETPFLSNGSPVYLDARSSKIVNSSDNLLAQIQGIIIGEIFKKHGWWLESSFGNRAPQMGCQPPRYPRDIWIELLQKFMTGLYSDRSLRLARLLREYLKFESENPKGAFFCGLKDFHTVWEKMLCEVIVGVDKEWNRKLPLPHYESHDGNLHPSSGMIPDAIVDLQDRLLVLDAKYYAATTVENSPNLADILKQMSYLNAVKSIAPNRDVETCFVFPQETGEPNKFISVKLLASQGKLSTEFPVIKCYYFQIIDIIQKYNSREKVEFGELVK